MISRLRHRVEILRPDEYRDGGGGVVRSWVPFSKMWVAIDEAGNVGNEIDPSRDRFRTYKIFLRKSEKLKSEYRIKIKKKIFRIKSIKDNLRRNNFWDVDIEEVEDEVP